jgi:ribonuclease HI
VANWDMWKILTPLVQERDVQWRKVKGHSGDPGNDLADRLAVKGKRMHQ